MVHVLGVAVVLLLCTVAAADDPPKDKDKPKQPTPKERYDALVKEYRDAQAKFFKAMRATTLEDRQKVTQEEASKLDKVLIKFVELAEKNSTDPIAVNALLQAYQNNFGTGTARKKAAELLMKNHLGSEKIGPYCQSLANDLDIEAETTLRTVLKKNTHKAVLAEASLALGQHLQQRARITRMLPDNVELMASLVASYGKKAAETMKMDDPAKLEKESEELLVEFATKHTVNLADDRLVALAMVLSMKEDKGSEVLARTLLKNKKKEIQGQACLALGQILRKQSDILYEKDAKKAAKIQAESEELLGRAAKEFADLKSFFGNSTVGERAKRELYELRNLAIGREAPDVEGEDQDGKKFKLSDYKGKVVFLDFWRQF